VKKATELCVCYISSDFEDLSLLVIHITDAPLPKQKAPLSQTDVMVRVIKETMELHGVNDVILCLISQPLKELWEINGKTSYPPHSVNFFK